MGINSNTSPIKIEYNTNSNYKNKNILEDYYYPYTNIDTQKENFSYDNNIKEYFTPGLYHLGLPWNVKINNNIVQSTTPGTFTSNGANDWGKAGALSSVQGYSQGCYVSFKNPDSNRNKSFLIGLSSINTGTSYVTVNFGIYISIWSPTSSSVEIFESGTVISRYGFGSVNDVYTITHDGENVRYYINNTLLRTTPYSGTLYLGNAFLHSSTIVTNLIFGPIDKCPPGYYCDAGNAGTNIDVCPPGYYCPTGTTGSNTYPCPSGYYCPTGSSLPIVCSPGTTQPLPGKASCITCPAGQYSTSTTSNCLTCPPGFYCGGSIGTNINICPQGYYCPTGTTGSNTYPCPPGYYCPRGSSSSTLCPAGTTQSLPGQSSCITCPAGQYSTSTTSGCLTCPAGSSCNNIYQCQAGTYNPISGATSISDCQKCPTGTYSTTIGANSNTTCQKCKAGTYSTTLGSISDSNCLNCKAGTYNLIPGATSISDCKPCSTGTFSSGSCGIFSLNCGISPPIGNPPSFGTPPLC